MYNKIILEMMNYFSKDPKRIQHFMKVFAFSRMIGENEKIPDDELNILCIAAILHDIGIKKAEENYNGRCDGKLQEELGPSVAKKMLEKLEIKAEVIDRVCYLIGHHHTYNNIKGNDYQILVESDFIVNAFEDEFTNEALDSAYKKIFKTDTGKRIFESMYFG